MPTFKNHAYFSVTSLVLNDVNVREGNVIKLSLKESVLIRSQIILAVKGKLNLKTINVLFMVVNCFIKKVQHQLC